MAHLKDLPFPRGTTATSGLATVDANVLASLEGTEYVCDDVDPALATSRTGRPVRLRIFRNKSGFALLPKRAFSYNTSPAGTDFSVFSSQAAGNCITTAQKVAIVDEYLPAAGVADGELFYGVIEGPALCKTDLAGGANNLIPIGTVVVALTAVTSNATTSGRVAPQDLTGSTANLANQIQNRIGHALTAKTTGNTNADILIDVVNQW